MKKELTLLGVWNQLPVGVWTWLNDVGVEQLAKLTGRKLGIFSYIKDDLNFECFAKSDTDLLKQDLDALSPDAQLEYVQKITDDYYLYAKPLEAEIQKAESANPTALDSEQLAIQIEKLALLWTKVTMQIWYAVLLDIWYPAPYDKAKIKAIIAEARDHCGHLHERSSKAEHGFYLEAAKRLGITEHEIYFMVQPEIAQALRGNMISRGTLESRLNVCVLTNHSGKVEVYGGAEAEKLKELFAVPALGAKVDGALKGTPACKGKVQGKARVILLDSEFPTFQDGEILVSLTTMVHYVPLMKKSSAILTEFGGLTSHAAVVSRELNKPSVVGISGLIASVKTGDMLEVDAEKGVVRKL